MENRPYKKMIYEIADNFISAAAINYVDAENKIKYLRNLILTGVKKISAVYAFCNEFISSMRETFLVRNKLKKIKSPVS